MNHEHSNLLNVEELEIFQKSISRLQELTGALIKERPRKKGETNKSRIPGTALQIQAGKEKAEFYVEIKNELREIHLPGLLDQIGKQKAEWLVVSRYIPKPLKVELKKQGINYLEASGNCFIHQGGILFFINDETVTPHRLPKEGKLWKSAGLKFLFAILQQPELLNEPYRNIAKTAGVALGNIGPFIEELINHDFLKQQKDGRFFLDNRKTLIVKWAELYVSVLKLKLKTGTFRFLDTQNVQNWKKIPDDLFYWGGAPAGAILTGFLQPENFTLYTTGSKMELMKELKLVPDVKGNIELVNIFWNEELFSLPVSKLNVVPPLLAYAELITSLDSRNREVAGRIEQKYLQ